MIAALEKKGISVYSLSQRPEYDLRDSNGVWFFPLKIDHEEMGASFKYYLSRQHWMDATIPPLEKRLDEFVKRIKTQE